MIKFLSIKRFKQLLDISLELDRINALVGANNSGKSSILHAIHFFVSVAQSRKLIDGKSITEQPDIDKYGGTIAPQQIIYTPAQDMMVIAHGGNLTQNKANSIEVSITLSSNQTGDLRVSRGKNRNIAIEMNGLRVIRKLETIEKPYSIYVPGLAGLAKTENYIAKGSLLRSLARGDSNLILRNVLSLLKKDEKRWGTFVQDLTDIFPNIKIKIGTNPDIDEFIDITITEKNWPLTIDYAGTGLLQTIQIMAYVNLFDPKIVLLDEPDSHLHPNNQRALALKLVEYAESRKTQIILATHSRHLLDSLGQKPKYIWVAQGHVKQVTDSIVVLKDLGALDAAEGLLAKGVKNVILSEDSDVHPLKMITYQYLKQEETIILSYNGCSNINTIKVLTKFIRDISATSKIIIHRDSDYMEDDHKEFWRAQYSRDGATVFFTKGINIESYFVRPDHLKAINKGHAKDVESAYEYALSHFENDIRNKIKTGALEARKQRIKDGLSARSIGEIQEWAETVIIDDERWIDGKFILPKIRQKFKEITNNELIVFKLSGFLQDTTDKFFFTPPPKRIPLKTRRPA